MVKVESNDGITKALERFDSRCRDAHFIPQTPSGDTSEYQRLVPLTWPGKTKDELWLDRLELRAYATIAARDNNIQTRFAGPISGDAPYILFGFYEE